MEDVLQAKHPANLTRAAFQQPARSRGAQMADARSSTRALAGSYSAASIPSSLSLRVSVLRPQPSTRGPPLVRHPIGALFSAWPSASGRGVPCVVRQISSSSRSSACSRGATMRWPNSSQRTARPSSSCIIANRSTPNSTS